MTRFDPKAVYVQRSKSAKYVAVPVAGLRKARNKKSVTVKFKRLMLSIKLNDGHEVIVPIELSKKSKLFTFNDVESLQLVLK